MWKITEIYYSLQCEGFHAGTPAVFIRFAGCNLNCSFCDSPHETGTNMSLYQIINEVNKYPLARMVVLTGGEPSISIDQAMVDALKRTGKTIAIETNGTNPLPQGIDWVILSPKNSFAGGNTVPVILNECDELKVVYLGQDLSQYNSINATHRYLQPCYCDEEDIRNYTTKSCINAVLASKNWKLSLQTQKLFNIK